MGGGRRLRGQKEQAEQAEQAKYTRNTYRETYEIDMKLKIETFFLLLKLQVVSNFRRLGHLHFPHLTDWPIFGTEGLHPLDIKIKTHSPQTAKKTYNPPTPSTRELPLSRHVRTRFHINLPSLQRRRSQHHRRSLFSLRRLSPNKPVLPELLT